MQGPTSLVRCRCWLGLLAPRVEAAVTVTVSAMSVRDSSLLFQSVAPVPSPQSAHGSSAGMASLRSYRGAGATIKRSSLPPDLVASLQSERAERAAAAAAAAAAGGGGGLSSIRRVSRPPSSLKPIRKGRMTLPQIALHDLSSFKTPGAPSATMTANAASPAAQERVLATRLSAGAGDEHHHALPHIPLDISAHDGHVRITALNLLPLSPLAGVRLVEHPSHSDEHVPIPRRPSRGHWLEKFLHGVFGTRVPMDTYVRCTLLPSGIGQQTEVVPNSNTNVTWRIPQRLKLFYDPTVDAESAAVARLQAEQQAAAAAAAAAHMHQYDSSTTHGGDGGDHVRKISVGAAGHDGFSVSRGNGDSGDTPLLYLPTDIHNGLARSRAESPSLRRIQEVPSVEPSPMFQPSRAPLPPGAVGMSVADDDEDEDDLLSAGIDSKKRRKSNAGGAVRHSQLLASPPLRQQTHTLQPQQPLHSMSPPPPPPSPPGIPSPGSSFFSSSTVHAALTQQAALARPSIVDSSVTVPSSADSHSQGTDELVHSGTTVRTRGGLSHGESYSPVVAASNGGTGGSSTSATASNNQPHSEMTPLNVSTATAAPARRNVSFFRRADLDDSPREDDVPTLTAATPVAPASARGPGLSRKMSLTMHTSRAGGPVPRPRPLLLVEVICCAPGSDITESNSGSSGGDTASSLPHPSPDSLTAPGSGNVPITPGFSQAHTSAASLVTEGDRLVSSATLDLESFLTNAGKPTRTSLDLTDVETLEEQGQANIVVEFRPNPAKETDGVTEKLHRAAGGGAAMAITPAGYFHIEVVALLGLRDPFNEPQLHSGPLGEWGFMLKMMAVVLLYLAAGVVFYVKAEGWSMLEAVYFCVVTATTTGYGDLRPSTQGSRVFTLFFILVGIGMIAIAVGIAGGLMLERQEQEMYRQMMAEKTRASTGKDAAANRTAGQTNNAFFGHTSKRLLISFILIQAVVWGGTIGFMNLEPDLTLFDALYLCVVTMATVGYGDNAPRSNAARAFCIPWMVLSAVVVSRIIGDVTNAYMNWTRNNRARAVLKTSVQSVEDLAALDDDNSGEVSELEFLKHMLVKTQACKSRDIEMICEQFRLLDVDGSGSINAEDFVKMAEQKERLRLGGTTVQTA